MSTGKLILVPMPIDENSKMSESSLDILRNAILSKDRTFVVEDLKPARRNWLRHGLDRAEIENFLQLNEHNAREMTKKLTEMLLKGEHIYLMSDAGMPAFLDPGRELVQACHHHHICVTSLYFSNSVILALALSGFYHRQFFFAGFVPQKNDERVEFFKKLEFCQSTTILIDTSYRMHKLLAEIESFDHLKMRTYFLAIDLNKPTEFLLRGSIAELLNKTKNIKGEFILIIEQK